MYVKFKMCTYTDNLFYTIIRNVFYTANHDGAKINENKKHSRENQIGVSIHTYKQTYTDSYLQISQADCRNPFPIS